MSPRAWQFLIQDILDAIERIQRYTTGMSLEQFEDDERTIDAVVRNFIIIGEAAAHIPKDITASHADVPWRLMGDMRNFAVHRYWGVEPAVMWQTITEDLPPLVLTLKALLSESR